jgi:hypothetical protein
VAEFGRNLGRAFVSISPDVSDFLAELTAKTKVAVSQVHPQVKVGVDADTKQAQAAIVGMLTRLKPVAAELSKLKLDADDKGVQSKITGVQSRVVTLARQMADLVMKADTSKIDAQVAKEEAALARLRQQASHVQLDLDTKQAEAREAILTKWIKDTEKSLKNMKGDINIAAAQAKIAAWRAEIRVLNSDAKEVEIGARTAAFDAAIAASEAKIRALKREAAEAGKIDPASLLAFESKLLGVEDEIDKFHAKLAEPVPIALTAELNDLRGRFAGLAVQISHLRIDANDAPLKAKLAAVQLEAVTLAKTLSDTEIGGDPVKMARARKDYADLIVSTEKFRALLVKPVAIAATPELEHLRDEADKLTASLGDIKVDLNSASAVAQMDALRLQAARLKASLADVSIGGDPVKIAAARAAVSAFGAAISRARGEVKAADDAIHFFFRTSERGGTVASNIWKVLTGHITLFGGVLNRVLPAMVTSVATWHLLTDAIIEMIAVWVPAGVAVAAWGAAASDTARDIFIRMKDVNTEFQATGRLIPGLSGNFHRLQEAVRPQVYQLFGDALLIMNRRGDSFNKMVLGTGRELDRLAARFTAAVTSGSGMNKFMEHAVEDVRLLGDSIGNLGGVFGAFFRAVPGFAEILLRLGDGFTKVMENAAMALEPLLAIGMWAHGAVIYIGAAATGTLALAAGLGKMVLAFGKFNEAVLGAGLVNLKQWGSQLVTAGLAVAAYFQNIVRAEGATGKLGAAFGFLTKIPAAGWYAAAAVGLGILIIALSHANDSARQFNDNIQKSLASVPVSQLGTRLAQSIAATASQVAKSQQQVNAALKETGPVIQGVAGHFQTNYNPALDRAAQVNSDFRAGLTQLQEQGKLVRGRFDELGKTYGNTTQVLGMLNAAGITSDQLLDKSASKWAATRVQVDATAAAFKLMGVQAGTLGNDLDVLGRTQTDLYTATQKLNQAWSTFISDVTGTQTSFDTTVQGFQTLENANQKITFSLGKLKYKFEDAKAGIDSLTPSGIALNQAFADQVGNIEKMTETWRTAGLSQDTFKSGIAAAIAPMEKYARGSKEATAQLVALGQMAGYQGPINLQQLNKYLGISGKMLRDTAGDTQMLKDAANQATIQEALLTGAMQAQGNYIANELLGDINNAILAYDGVRGAAKRYGEMIAQHGRDSPQAAAALKTLTDGIIKSGLASGSSTPQIAAMIAKVAGIKPPEAMKLINKYLLDAGTGAKGAGPAFQQLGLAMQYSGMNSGLTKDKMAALGQILVNSTGDVKLAKLQWEQIAAQHAISKSAADKLWDSIANRLNVAVKESTTATPLSKAAFEDWAKNGLKYSKDKADELWTQITQKFGPDLGKLNLTAKDAKAKFYEWAIGGLHKSKDEADALWQKLAMEKLTEAGRKATTTKGDFEKMAAQLGISKDQADKLFDSLHKLPPTTKAEVIMDGKGHYIISQQMTSATNPFPGGITGRAAQGGFISSGTGPTADDVPAWLSRGELVVPASMVSAGAVDHLRGRLPGFAAGGGIGSMPPPLDPGFHATMYGNVPRYGGAETIAHGANGLFIPGFQAGGVVQAPGNWGLTPDFITGMYRRFAGAMAGSLILNMAKSMIAAEKQAMAGLAAGPQAGRNVLAYAGQYANKVPYVWGGSTPAGWDCCLAPDALVSTLAGPKAITDIGPGDVVWAWDDGRPVRCQVLRRSRPRRKATLRVVTATAKLRASGDHRFLVSGADGTRWSRADELAPGDLVMRLGDRGFTPEEVLFTEPAGGAETYDITVQGAHNFVADGLVVHNSGFVSWVYNHLGIRQGRDVAAGFQSWAKPSAAVPGGLVFFGSPAHHVGFVVNGKTMLSALGRQWGTIYSSLGGNSGFGIPPQWAQQMRGISGGIGFAPGPSATGTAAAAQALARSILWAYGWGQNQWPYLLRLWNQESNWSANAVNPRSGAYGIPQALPSVWDHPYALGDYANQVRWGLAYISGRYPGGPAEAWAHEVAHNWYGRGGLVPGLATGGTVGQFREKLGLEQLSEMKSYAEVARHRHQGGFSRTTYSELDTLAKRQAAEVLAYREATGRGLSDQTLRHFLAMVHAEQRTAGDKGLQKLSGIGKLKQDLADLNRIGGNPPAIPDKIAPPPPPAWKVPGHLTLEDWWKYLRAHQAHEISDYRALRRSFEHDIAHAPLNSWIHRNRATLRSELGTLAKRQEREQHAFDEIAFRGPGANKKTLAALRAAIKTELRTTGDKALSHWPEGHLGRIYGLRHWLYALDKLASMAVPPSTEKVRPPLVPPAPQARVLAGEFSFDRGGTLKPGWNLAYNGLGRDEDLVPAGGGGGDIHVHLHNEGVIGSRAELDNWLSVSVDRLARQGRLTYALRRSFSAS